MMLLALLAYCQYNGSGTGGGDAAPGASSTAAPERTGPSGAGSAPGGGTTAPGGGATADGRSAGAGLGAAGTATATRTTQPATTPATRQPATTPATTRPGTTPGSTRPAAPTGAPHTGGGDGLGMRSPLLAGLGIVLLLGASALLVFRLRPRTGEG
ncbi:hypothetical protein [Dactylosporangium darangshiense]|uniref:hypothetical protein n=1 Tax=Dactylosporangium darangshiense TaxID=579108 RepID=UPI0036311CF5